jgi:DnaJ-class molecular chaperone
VGSAVIEKGPIKDGIEFFRVVFDDGRVEEDSQCARCGSSVESVSCPNCGGDGFLEYEDDWQGMEMRGCDWCAGEGGSLHCVSLRKWCEEHPMKGREHIESTAFARPEAWTD